MTSTGTEGEHPSNGGVDHGFTVPATPARRFGEFATALFSVFLCLLSIFPPSDTYIVLLRLVIAPLSALTAVEFVRRTFDGRPRLVVDSEGITDRTSLLGGRLHIPWEDVRRVGVSRMRGTVEVEVADPVKLREGAPPGRRFWMRVGHLLGKRTISVTPTMVGVPKDVLARRLDEALFEFERKVLRADIEATAVPTPDHPLPVLDGGTPPP